MQADNTDEYYDISTRNKIYGRVDALNGPLLLEKYYLPGSFLNSRENVDQKTGLRAQYKAP